MPKLVPQHVKDHAYDLYRTGSSVAEIAENLNTADEYRVSIRAVESWRDRDNWKSRREKDQLDEQTGKLRTANDELFLNAGLLMERAIDLAFNAESETVRATQQRYLLGSLGISPETAQQRVQALAQRQAQLQALVEQPIKAIEDALVVMQEVDAGWDDA
ncbi:MAG: hypothetical protein WBA46_01775 [Thermomicrobiales bacterium]